MNRFSLKSAFPWLEKYPGQVLLLILVITFFAYINLFRADFVDYDDPGNVVHNPFVTALTPGNIEALFTSAIHYSYNPFTFLSYAVEYRIFGMNAAVFHTDNIILHLLNIVLLFILARKLTGNSQLSLFSAALFAFHPVQSDVIGWISARNYLLCTAFYLSSLIFFILFLEKQKHRWFDLLVSLLLFLSACLSKSQAVTLPLILFCIDRIYKIKYTPAQVLIRAVFLLIAVGAGVLTIYFRGDMGKTEVISDFTILDKIFLFAFSFIKYLFKILVPAGLTAIDPYPLKSGNGYFPVIVYLSPLIMIFLAAMGIVFRKYFTPLILLGLFFFTVNIFISQVTFLEDGFSANRYAYLSSAGLFIIIPLICMNSERITKSVSLSGKVIILLILVIFIITAHKRSQQWHDTESLAGAIIRRSPEVIMAYNIRGIWYYNKGEIQASIQDFNTAISIHTGYSSAWYNRGLSYAALNDFASAKKDYSKAIELNPGFVSAYIARGILKLDIYADFEGAVADFSEAVKLKPTNAQAWYNRGLAYFRMQDTEKACNDWMMVKKLGFSQADIMISRYCQ